MLCGGLGREGQDGVGEEGEGSGVNKQGRLPGVGDRSMTWGLNSRGQNAR